MLHLLRRGLAPSGQVRVIVQLCVGVIVHVQVAGLAGGRELLLDVVRRNDNDPLDFVVVLDVLADLSQPPAEVTGFV